MRHRLTFRAVTACFLLTLLLGSIPALAVSGGSNRYNVMIVLDASGSMRYTDPSGYRYDAVGQFVHLLSERGDVLGYLAFSTGVDAQDAPRPMEGRAAKEAVADALKAVPATGGYTNIGLALSEAVRLLQENGEPSLPSVIVLLSDGNTDMNSPEAQERSLEQKADAIQAARESNIRVYSVCLNVDNPTYHADVSEMEQVSRGTGGVSVAVERASDLREVFNAFYDMIYGTSTTTVVDEVFPPTGALETRFEVPGVGVEEVNIIINGKTSRISLKNPSGSEADASRYEAEGFTMLKVTEAEPGSWVLLTEGVPGDQIKVNMVYNSSLTVEARMDPPDSTIDIAQWVTFTAVLRDTAAPDSAGADGVTAADDRTGSLYAGYRAVLNVLDAYRQPLRQLPMTLGEDGFTVTEKFSEGTYFFTVSVTGNYLSRESDPLGPVTFGDYVINTAPEPYEEKITEDLAVYPFRDAKFVLDLRTLASDPEGGELRYEIVSSSFIEGTDYTVSEDDVLTLDHFSISKGAFTVRATDEYGLSCDVEVVVRTHNVGLIALLSAAVAALIALLLLYLLYDRLFPPFRGEITVSTLIDGEPGPAVSRNPRRGRCPLSLFEAGDIGLDPSKSWFRSSGGREITFLPSRPVTVNGLDSGEVRVLSGTEVSVCVAGDCNRRMFIRFESRMPGTHRRGGRPEGGHARPTGGGRDGGRPRPRDRRR